MARAEAGQEYEIDRTGCQEPDAEETCFSQGCYVLDCQLGKENIKVATYNTINPLQRRAEPAAELICSTLVSEYTPSKACSHIRTPASGEGLRTR